MRKNVARSSYSSANEFPAKLLFMPSALQFKPVHIQWMPTNRCNLNCPSCSCAHRDKDLEMDISKAQYVIERFRELGCLAVTVTGGGEPLLYPHISRMLHCFYTQGIKIGLVTNGLLLPKLPNADLEKLAWCRISHMDGRAFTEDYKAALKETVLQNPQVDWAFSYVVSLNPQLDTIEELLGFATDLQFSHVRIVADLLQPEAVDLKPVRQRLRGRDMNVIYQSRTEYQACTQCLLGYIKPVIAPDFSMYLCCSAQYALRNDRDMPAELLMGNASELDTVYRNTAPYSVNCRRCYYTQYNQILSAALVRPRHAEFV